MRNISRACMWRFVSDVRVGIAGSRASLERTHGIIEDSNRYRTWPVSGEMLSGLETFRKICWLCEILTGLNIIRIELLVVVSERLVILDKILLLFFGSRRGQKGA